MSATVRRPDSSSSSSSSSSADSAADAFAGVDVAKDSLAACVLSGDRRHDAAAPYTDEGVAALLADFTARGVRLVVCEATGGLERRLVVALLAAGLPVVVINPKQMRDFARGLGKRAKNDPVDACVIARFAQMVRPAPRALPSEQQALLNDLAARRSQLVQMRVAELNRLQQATAPRIVRGIGRLIKALDKQVKEVEGLMAEQIAADPQWTATAAILDSVPGIAVTTAHQLVAELPELGRLDRRQIAALAGLAPYDHDSGKYKGQRRIGGGRAQVRCALFMVMLSAIAKNPLIKPVYDRLVAAGKKKMVALTACMRKLLVILNAMVKNRTMWNPRLAAAAAPAENP
jgi:transposase